MAKHSFYTVNKKKRTEEHFMSSWGKMRERKAVGKKVKKR